MTGHKNQRRYTFGAFSLDADERRLQCNDKIVPLARKAFDLLLMLLENAGRLCTREQLIEALWPDKIVEEQGLTTRIHAVRQALGDVGECAAFVETVRGVGYRFIAPVVVEDTVTAATQPPPVNRARHRWWVATSMILIGFALVVGGLAWYFIARPHDTATASNVAPSIAVLPFENLSSDPANAYFAAGIQDEILTRLALIGSLKVISRTSTAHFASRPTNLRTIGHQLGVATVLEGSVQKAGNKVHINVQLIDVASRAHIWAHSYNRKLTDVFDIEGEVAGQIAAALEARLQPAESAMLARAPTSDPQAYDAYLQGRYYANRAASSLAKSDYDAAIQSYERAVQDDPDFALAYARLSLAQSSKLHTMSYRGAFDTQLANQAKSNADHALALAPALAQGYLAKGYYRDYAKHDTDGQLAAFNTALALNPHNPETRYAIGVIYGNRAQFDTAIENFRMALERDPENIGTIVELATIYMYVHRYAAAENILGDALRIHPESVNATLFLVTAEVLRTGTVEQAIALMDAAPAAVRNSPSLRDQRAELEYARRNYTAAHALFAALKPGGSSSAWDIALERGDLEWAAGDHAKALGYYQTAANILGNKLQAHPDTRLHAWLAWADARLGRDNDALAQIHTALSLSPADKHPLPHMRVLFMKAQIQAQLGHTKAAVAGLRHLLAMPSGYVVSVPLLRLDPNWDSIRHDASFQALLSAHTPGAGARADMQGPARS